MEKPFVLSGFQNALSDSILWSKLAPFYLCLSAWAICFSKSRTDPIIEKMKGNITMRGEIFIDHPFLMIFVGNTEPALDCYISDFKR